MTTNKLFTNFDKLSVRVQYYLDMLHDYVDTHEEA